MASSTNSKLRISVMEEGNAATIYLDGSFVFDSHINFKDAYNRLLDHSAIDSISIDLAAVKYLDSSALGMLLILNDRIQLAQKSLTLSKPSPVAKQAFAIANFERIFAIQ